MPIFDFDRRGEIMATTTLNKLEALKEAYPDEKELESVCEDLLGKIRRMEEVL